MRKISVVVASLLCSLVALPQAASASDGRLSLAEPVAVNQATARLSGRAPAGHRSVILQRWADGRWMRADRVPVKNRTYRTTVSAAASPVRYRTVVDGHRSKVRSVPASTATASTPRPTTALAPTAPADACGTALFAADKTRRVCTFADSFDGTKLDRTKWAPQTHFMSGDLDGRRACYRDHPDNVSVSGGILKLTVRDEGRLLACAMPGGAPSRYTAGMVTTYHLFSQRYGRFESRIKTQATNSPGLHEAFWLWPDDREATTAVWPAAGEIDIVETYSQHPTLAIPFLHYTANDNGGPIAGVNTAWNCTAQRGVWNTYALEWTASRLEIFVNGRSCLVNTTGDPAFQRKYIIALTAGLGLSTNQHVGTAPMPATMSVDYVRVWK